MECMWKTKSKSEKLQQSRDLKKKKGMREEKMENKCTLSYDLLSEHKRNLFTLDHQNSQIVKNKHISDFYANM